MDLAHANCKDASRTEPRPAPPFKGLMGYAASCFIVGLQQQQHQHQLVAVSGILAV